MTLPVRYEVEHVSRYGYASPMRHCVMAVCLRPQDDERQHLLRFDLTTDPPTPHNPEADAFGNTKHVLNIHREHDGLTITAHSIVVVLPVEAVPESVGAEAWGELQAASEPFADWDYTRPTPLTTPTAELRAFMERTGLGAAAADPLTALRALTAAIHDSFTYEAGSTSVGSPIDQMLATGKGVCQDYAHVMLAVTRLWGVPSRYVSGYVDIGETRSGATHAWVEGRLPGLGWVGFDPTNGCLADHRHIRIGAGRDYRDVAPTRGVLQGAGATELAVEVRVRQLP